MAMLGGYSQQAIVFAAACAHPDVSQPGVVLQQEGLVVQQQQQQQQ